MTKRKFLKERDKTKWKTSDKRQIPISELKTNHLQNIMRWVAKEQKDWDELKLGDKLIYTKPAKDWIDLMKLELSYRVSGDNV